MSIEDQIEYTRDQWKGLLDIFFMKLNTSSLVLPRRFKISCLPFIMRLFACPPSKPLDKEKLLSVYSWMSPGEYLQIGQVISEDERGLTHYFPVCCSLISRQEWIDREENWMVSIVPSRIRNCKDEKSRLDEIQQAERLKERIHRAKMITDFYLTHNDFVLLEDPQKIKFMFWRSKE